MRVIVEAHGFQPCDRASERTALAPVEVSGLAERTFFITSVTWGRRPIFRSELSARLFLDTLFRYREQGKFQLYEFVVMPDHIHILRAPSASFSLERSVQFIKGGYSHRFMKETGSRMEIWERSFTNHRVRDSEDYEKHRWYIHLNPVRAGLVERPQDYSYSSARPGFRLDQPPQRLKPVA